MAGFQTQTFTSNLSVGLGGKIAEQINQFFAMQLSLAVADVTFLYRKNGGRLQRLVQLVYALTPFGTTPSAYPGGARHYSAEFYDTPGGTTAAAAASAFFNANTQFRLLIARSLPQQDYDVPYLRRDGLLVIYVDVVNTPALFLSQVFGGRPQTAVASGAVGAARIVGDLTIVAPTVLNAGGDPWPLGAAGPIIKQIDQSLLCHWAGIAPGCYATATLSTTTPPALPTTLPLCANASTPVLTTTLTFTGTTTPAPPPATPPVTNTYTPPASTTTSTTTTSTTTTSTTTTTTSTTTTTPPPAPNIWNPADKNASITLSGTNDNTAAIPSGSNLVRSVRSRSLAAPAFRLVAEVTITAAGGWHNDLSGGAPGSFAGMSVGIAQGAVSTSNYPGEVFTAPVTSVGLICTRPGISSQIITNGTASNYAGSASPFGAGDVLGIVLNSTGAGSYNVVFYINGVFQSSSSVGAISSGSTPVFIAAGCTAGATGTAVLNVAGPFVYSYGTSTPFDS